MKIQALGPFSDVLLITQRVLGDDSGFFFESFHAQAMAQGGIT